MPFPPVMRAVDWAAPISPVPHLSPHLSPSPPPPSTAAPLSSPHPPTPLGSDASPPGFDVDDGRRRGTDSGWNESGFGWLGVDAAVALVTETEVEPSGLSHRSRWWSYRRRLRSCRAMCSRSGERWREIGKSGECCWAREKDLGSLPSWWASGCSGRCHGHAWERQEALAPNHSLHIAHRRRRYRRLRRQRLRRERKTPWRRM